MANPALEHLNSEINDPTWDPSSNNRVVTLDTVIEKTAITLAILIASAIGAWAFLGNAISNGDYSAMQMASTGAIIASFSALGLSFLISFKKSISPILIMLFAVIEGLVIGFVSKVVAIEVQSNEPVYGAIIGTFVAAAATLFAYKFFNIQVSDRMRKYTMIAMFSIVGLSLANVGMMLFGKSLGIEAFGPLGMVFSVIGLIVALFMLLIDFDAVEKAIQYRLPEEYSWKLAFGLLVTLVWIYFNLLKILAAARR